MRNSKRTETFLSLIDQENDLIKNLDSTISKIKKDKRQNFDASFVEKG